MTVAPITADDVAALSALASGIIPADARDAGAAEVNAGAGLAERARRTASGPLYVTGLAHATQRAREKFGRNVAALSPDEIHALLTTLAETSPAFFRQLRADTCALYLSDPGVLRRIGFPGPSSASGGYPDFDRQKYGR